ncbi:MAG TPA: hypothetical protein VEU55_07790 [Gemmatimonadales bacterium]|nr:hypothetical protein [Gemmatimonadales bacterium]
MGKINWNRVVVAGLLAGVVLNVIDFAVYGVWLKQDFAAAMQALGKQPPGGSTILLYVVLDFVYGIGLLWLYAAIRPRFGAGPRTAVIAGLALWFFIHLLHAVGEASMGMWPTRLYTIDVIVGVIELPLAAAIGAYLYQEV